MRGTLRPFRSVTPCLSCPGGPLGTSDRRLRVVTLWAYCKRRSDLAKSKTLHASCKVFYSGRLVFAVLHICGQAAEYKFHLRNRQTWVLAEDFGRDTGDVRGSIAIARSRDPIAVQPGHPHIYAGCAELNRRVRVVEESIRVFEVVRSH